MTAGLVFVLLLAAFAALALSQYRHHRDIFGVPPSLGRTRLLRSVAWPLLAVSVGAAVQDEAGLGVGLALWFGVATASALIVAMALTYSHLLAAQAGVHVRVRE